MILFRDLKFVIEQARKGFRPPSAMKGIGYFQNFLEIFWIFWGIILEFFRRIFFGGIFLEEFFGRIFLGGFFGRIFWEELFGRNYLVEINKEYCNMNVIYVFVKILG